MLKVELWIDDEEKNEEMVSNQILRTIMENGIKITNLNIEHMKLAYKKPEIKEIQIPEFLRSRQCRC